MKRLLLICIVFSFSVGLAQDGTVRTKHYLMQRADSTQSGGWYSLDLQDLIETALDSSGILLRKDLLDDSLTATLGTLTAGDVDTTGTQISDALANRLNLASWSDSVDNLTINEAQISDLNHYDDADIGGNEAAFNGWDKNVSDDDSIAYGEVTSTTYILALSDTFKTLLLNNVDSVRVTVPPYSSVAFEEGTWIRFIQKGAGQGIVAPGSGVTLQSEYDDTRDSLNSQWSVYVIEHSPTQNTWIGSGSAK